jgi:hypothetical protein
MYVYMCTYLTQIAFAVYDLLQLHYTDIIASIECLCRLKMAYYYALCHCHKQTKLQ